MHMGSWSLAAREGTLPGSFNWKGLGEKCMAKADSSARRAVLMGHKISGGRSSRATVKPRVTWAENPEAMGRTDGWCSSEPEKLLVSEASLGGLTSANTR
jgi:hypothetical protein